MPDAQLNIKANDQATPTFKKVQDAFRQMDTLVSKFNRQGPFSQKDIDKGARALKNFHQEYLNGLKILQNYQRQVVSLQKSLEGFEKGSVGYRRITSKIGSLRERQAGLTDTLAGGPGTAGALQNRMAASQETGGAAFMGRLGSALVGGIGLGSAIAIVSKSLTAASSVNDNLVDMVGNLRLNSSTLENATQKTSDLVSEIRGDNPSYSASILAQKLGYSRLEFSAMAGGMARTGGYGGNVDTILTMMSLQRRFGIGTESMEGLSRVSGLGNRYLTSATMNTLASEAIASGLKRPLQEFFNSVTGLVEQFQQQGAISPNLGMVGGMLSMMGYGYNNPMLQGQRGAQILGQLNQSLMAPGGGIAGQLAMLNVAGFGGKTDWWQAQKTLSQGFGGPEGNKLLANLLKQARSYGPEGMEEFLTYVGGLNPMQAEALSRADVKGRLEGPLRGMTTAEFSKFGSAYGVGESVDTTVDFLKSANLGTALLALNQRAVMSNAYQDIGQAILGDLAEIVRNTSVLYNLFSGGGQHPLTGAAVAAAGMTNPFIQWFISHYQKSSK